jgi:hypothetical protein
MVFKEYKIVLETEEERGSLSWNPSRYSRAVSFTLAQCFLNILCPKANRLVSIRKGLSMLFPKVAMEQFCSPIICLSPDPQGPGTHMEAQSTGAWHHNTAGTCHWFQLGTGVGLKT